MRGLTGIAAALLAVTYLAAAVQPCPSPGLDRARPPAATAAPEAAAAPGAHDGHAHHTRSPHAHAGHAQGADAADTGLKAPCPCGCGARGVAGTPGSSLGPVLVSASGLPPRIARPRAPLPPVPVLPPAPFAGRDPIPI